MSPETNMKRASKSIKKKHSPENKIAENISSLNIFKTGMMHYRYSPNMNCFDLSKATDLRDLPQST